jgi:two-component system NtrC family sensor kinase
MITTFTVVSYLIYISGGVKSIFFPLYFLPIIGVNIHLPVRMVHYSALFSSLSFLTVCFLDILRGNFTGKVFFEVGVKVFLLLLVSFLCEYIGQRLELQQRAVKERHEAFQKEHRKLLETQEQLIQAEKISSVGRLASGIAHELNNPLTGVVGFSQIISQRLLKGNVSREWVYQRIKEIEKSSRRCKEIIDTLSEFYQSGEDNILLVDINTCIRKTLLLVQEQLRIQKIEIITNLGANLPRVKASFSHLQQVFLNLILNAKEAMKDGGKLFIKSALVNNHIEITFRDTGVGIPGENLNRIFEPFFTTRQPGEGAGLGLTLCFRIVKQYGGEISVKSKVGEGSAFKIKLNPVV